MNFKSIIFYVLYTITAFFLFAWLVFPSQKAATILSGRLNTLNDQVEVEINKVNPGMMLTCKIDQAEIIISNKVKFTLGLLKISPSLFSIFSAKKETGFEIKKGQCSINKSSIIFKARGDLKEVNDLQVRGNILFSDIVTKINDIPILHVMGMSELNFSTIDFEFIRDRDKDKIEILNFYAKGDQCNIKVKGNIFLSSKSGEIKLDFKTNIQPNPSYLSKFAGVSSVTSLFDGSDGGIKLHISGTLENPKVKL
ncbi:MAG: hypothetical protein K8R67_18150 [Desulfobacteraceae bacterium]|nr:hypothetical protein [Desulfobacteraceae bacterium]